MIKTVFFGVAFLSPFLFPFPVTVVFAFCAALFFPPVALLAGVLTDLLYYAPGAGAWPIASIICALAAVAAFFVRRFLKARIMV